MSAETMGNPLLAIGQAVPTRLIEARAERAKHVAVVVELSNEIAQLEALQLLGKLAQGTPQPKDEPEAPDPAASGGQTATPRSRRTHTPAEPATGSGGSGTVPS